MMSIFLFFSGYAIGAASIILAFMAGDDEE
jgi:hypothetical protein